MDETKVELFGRNTQYYVWRKSRHSTPTLNPLSKLRCMVKRASCFGGVLLHQGLVTLPSLTEKLIPKFFRTFCRKIYGLLSTNCSWTDDGWCNRIATQSKEANQLHNGIKHKKIHLLQLPNQTQCKNIAELKPFCKEEWSKIPPDCKNRGFTYFCTLHCQCLHVVFNKSMETYNCFCVIRLKRLYLLFELR